jgi:hypothetical protein
MGIDLFGIHESTSLTFLQLSYTEAEGGLKGEHRPLWLIFHRSDFRRLMRSNRLHLRSIGQKQSERWLTANRLLIIAG